jgi:pimeloyl-ACP methyl ester carboxylesterase
VPTSICPLYLMTGEYDFSCTTEDTLRTAAQIPGAEVRVMKELGHFPMSENPARFREYILPVLDKIAR